MMGVEQALRFLCVNIPRQCSLAGLKESQSMSLTWNPKRIPRRRKHGFLSRMATKDGRAVLKARRNKGRWKLSVSDEHRKVQRGHR